MLKKENKRKLTTSKMPRELSKKIRDKRSVMLRTAERLPRRKEKLKRLLMLPRLLK